MGEPKLIHANVWNAAGRHLFKHPANARSQAQTIHCTESDNCSLFAVGSCIASGSSRHQCKFGTSRVEVGFTKRARKNAAWVQERLTRYEGIPYIQKADPCVAKMGGHFYVHLPYLKEQFYPTGDFYLAEEFTPEMVKRLAEAQPRTMFDRYIIREYQEKVVPKFLRELKTLAPDLLERAAAISEHIRSVKLTDVGRRAVLSTLAPNVGTFGDRNWVWDGEWLTTTNPSILGCVVKAVEMRARPKEGVVVEVTDDGQVTPDTVFKT